MAVGDVAAKDAKCCRMKRSWPCLWRTVLIFGAVCIVLGFTLSAVIHKKLHDGVVDEVVVDSPSASGYKYWHNDTQEDASHVYQKYYFFDITNVPAVLAGSEPMHVEQRGPYVFRDYQVKSNLTWTDDEKEVTFYNWEFYKYAGEDFGIPESVLDQKITNINPVLMSAIREADNVYEGVAIAVMSGLLKEFVELFPIAIAGEAVPLVFGEEVFAKVANGSNVLGQIGFAAQAAGRLASLALSKVPGPDAADFFNKKGAMGPAFNLKGVATYVGADLDFSDASVKKIIEGIGANATTPGWAFTYATKHSGSKVPGVNMLLRRIVEDPVAVMADYELSPAQLEALEGYLGLYILPVVANEVGNVEETAEVMILQQWANGTWCDSPGYPLGEFSYGWETGFTPTPGLTIEVARALWTRGVKDSLANSSLTWLLALEKPAVMMQLAAEFKLPPATMQRIITWLLTFALNEHGLVVESILAKFAVLGPDAPHTLDDLTYIQWGTALVTNSTLGIASLADIPGVPLPIPGVIPEIHTWYETLFHQPLDLSPLQSKTLLVGTHGLSTAEGMAAFLEAASSSQAPQLAHQYGITLAEVEAVSLYIASLTSQFDRWYTEASGGGLFITKTAREWIFGYEDPLTALRTPQNPYFAFYPNETSVADKMALNTGGPNTWYTGKGNLTQVAQYKSWNGSQQVHVWAIPIDVEGTDGQNFEPFLKDGQTLKIWVKELQRPIKFPDSGQTVTVRGIKMNRYIIEQNEFEPASTNPFNKVFFQTVKGLCNVTSLHGGAPLYLSKPHFLEGDRVLLKNVTGLDPSKALHDTIFDVEPITGAAMNVAKRLQVSMQMEKTHDPVLTRYNNVRYTYVPITWASEEGEISEHLAKKFRNKVYVAKDIIVGGTVVGWVGVALCVLGLGAMGYVAWQKRKRLQYDTMRD